MSQTNVVGDWLKAHYKSWYDTSFRINDGNVGHAATIYGVANGLDDDTIDKLRTWTVAGFTEV